ncbi:phage holin family protein [Virgibacillus pantothenticus]|uniref:phage holin family protein n=1 Tax=Virgibacillus pantothenticus TaxID=1473 RepID=UPI003D283FF2
MVDMIINMAKTTTAVASVVFAFLYGGWTVSLIALVVFVVLDYITGIAASAYEGKLSSRVGFWGIGKKVFIFAMVATAHVIDLVLIDATEIEAFVMTATIYFYIVNELVSILENAGRLSLPIPSPIRKAINIFQGRFKDYDDDQLKEKNVD